MVGPGEETKDDGVGVGDFASASGVVEVAVEAGEGGQTPAGVGDALDDLGRFGGSGGVGTVMRVIMGFWGNPVHFRSFAFV